MCDQLHSVNSAVRANPALDTVTMVFDFLNAHEHELGPIAWTAVCGPWDQAVDRVFDTMRVGPLHTAWPSFVNAWDRVYAATKHTCASPTSRWMVTQTPPDGPWGGRAICAPTLDPLSQVKRSYASRGECDMALQLLDPQEPAVAITDTVQCSEAGCDQVVSWAPRPTR
jgi:hypothetical protein